MLVSTLVFALIGYSVGVFFARRKYASKGMRYMHRPVRFTFALAGGLVGLISYIALCLSTPQVEVVGADILLAAIKTADTGDIYVVSGSYKHVLRLSYAVLNADGSYTPRATADTESVRIFEDAGANGRAVLRTITHMADPRCPWAFFVDAGYGGRLEFHLPRGTVLYIDTSD